MKNYKLGIFLSALVVVVMLGAGIYLFAGNNSLGNRNATAADDGKEAKKSKSKKNAKANQNVGSATKGDCFGGKLTELQAWTMPDELVEISSIAWMGNQKVAAVQDNEGIIYVYNLATEKVEKKIKFGAKGDYEGLTYANGHFFVMRSDAFMFEVSPEGKILNEYDLPLTVTDNIEPFYFDAVNNRMLLGQKDGAKGAKTKNFYSFDLASRKFSAKAVYTINLSNQVVACSSASGNDSEKDTKKKKGKKKNVSSGGSLIRPSELAIDPKSKDIFIADGPNQRILVLSPEGNPKYYLSLDAKSFPQVEGMLFSPTGELYISTEGAKGPAKISKMSIILN